MIAFLDQRSHPRTSNLPLEGSHHIRKVEASRSIGRGCRLHYQRKCETKRKSRSMSMLRTANFDGRFELEKDRLIDEDVTSLEAEILDLVLLKMHRLAWP